MSAGKSEMLVRGLALVAAIVAAIVAASIDGEGELVALMGGSVIASLACFDRALDRSARSFGPWLLVSGAVLGKLIPAIAVDLADESLSEARYDLIGSIAFGGLLACALTLLALPSRTARPLIALLTIAGVGGVIGASGTAIGFRADPALGTAREARLLQGAGWLTVGLSLAAAAIALAVTRRVSRALAGLAVLAVGFAVLIALEVSGREIDFAWWLAAMAALAGLALFESSSFGDRRARDRSTLGVALTGAVGVVVAVAVIARAEAGRSTWADGSVAVAIAGTVLAVIAAAAVAGQSRARPAEPAPLEDDAESAERASAASPTADRATRGIVQAASTLAKRRTVEADSEHADVDAADPAPGDPIAPQGDRQGGERAQRRDDDPHADPSPIETFVVPEPTERRQSGPGVPPVSAADPGSRADEPEPAPAVEVAPAPEPVPDDTDTVEPVAIALARDRAEEPEAHGPAASAAIPLVRHLETLEPHHFDPPTGLLSAAGLQEIVSRAFAQRGAQGQIALLMIGLRNIDEIEAGHGRVAVAQVNRVIAERLRTALPRAACAHYLRSGFAAVLEQRFPPDEDPVEVCTEALVALLDEISVRDDTIRVDVVGGMAQSYSDEDAAGLVRRAGLGLEQAVRSPEPSLVSMP